MKRLEMRIALTPVEYDELKRKADWYQATQMYTCENCGKTVDIDSCESREWYEWASPEDDVKFCPDCARGHEEGVRRIGS